MKLIKITTNDTDMVKPYMDATMSFDEGIVEIIVGWDLAKENGASILEHKLKEKGIKALGKEGMQESKWILLDYDDVIIHIFQKEERGFYDLERLWDECPRIPCS